MTKTTRPTTRGLGQRLVLGGFALLAVALVSGCGAEADKGEKTNPNATAVPVAGMSKEEYAAQMQQKAAQMGGGGGGGMPGAPGAPGAAPGAPGAPPGPPPAAPK